MVLYSVVLNKLQISENYGLMKLASAEGFYLLTLSRMEAGVRAWLLSCDVPPLPRRLPLPLTEKICWLWLVSIDEREGLSGPGHHSRGPV